MSEQRRPVEEFEVTDDLPNSPMHTTGMDHVTLIGSNAEETIEFYRDLLGMSLVLRQPNLDDPTQTHLLFDTGDGSIVTFFVDDDRDSDPRPLRTPVGGVHHVSFSVDPEKFEEVMQALDDAGRGYNHFDRGPAHSLYTQDHNGFVIELSTLKWAIPDERIGEVLATSQQYRVEDGADFTEERHVESALEELDMDVEKFDLPDASTGIGV